MANPGTERGLILFAHGSRDPQWAAPLEAVATRARQLAPTLQVRCAYLELTEPDLPTCVAEMASLGVTAITVVPMFLGVGRHAREDMPRLVADVQARHPEIFLRLQSTIGEDARVIELLARFVLGDA